MKTIILFVCGLLFSLNVTTRSVENPGARMSEHQHERPVLDDQPVLVRGNVKNTSGAAISGASVRLTLSGNSTPSYSATTNSSGAYQWDAVTPATYTMAISATGYVTKSFTLVVSGAIDRTDTLIAQ